MTDQAKDLYEGVGPSTSAPAHEVLPLLGSKLCILMQQTEGYGQD